jgi:hypothetical protein
MGARPGTPESEGEREVHEADCGEQGEEQAEVEDV